MNVEQSAEVRRRAAKHAALGDPARLGIVDLLTLGDLSPTEIRLALGIPANLIAHHLNVLETAGMIVRSRSEADKRRSYVRLSPAALEEIHPGRTAEASRVVFVCTANSARSKLAERLWTRHSDIPVLSGGTHPAERVDPGAIAAGRRHGLALTDSGPRTLPEALSETDFVVTVCDNAHEELTPTGQLHWSIPDPVPDGSDDAFDAVYAELERRIIDLAPRLTAV